MGLNLLLVFTPVVWFISCTTLAVAVKWIVLGRCFQGRIPLSSPTYLGWWYVNATLKVWEKAGGWWLLDTRLLILVYRLLGAQVSATAYFDDQQAVLSQYSEFLFISLRECQI